jgi:hypothetical protein
MAMATFPSFQALSPLSPSAPPSSLLHDLTISLLGTKFDSDGPLSPYFQVLMSPDLAIFLLSDRTITPRNIRDGSHDRRMFGTIGWTDRRALLPQLVNQPVFPHCALVAFANVWFIRLSSRPRCRRSMYVHVPSNLYLPLLVSSSLVLFRLF